MGPYFKQCTATNFQGGRTLSFTWGVKSPDPLELIFLLNSLSKRSLQTLDMGKNLQKIIDSAHLLFKKHPPSYLAEKSKTYERCSIISEFRQLEPTVRLVDGPKISSSYRQVATAFAVGVSLFALYMNLFV